MDEASLQLATAAGIDVQVIPFIRTVIREEAELRHTLSALPDGITAVFTSRNGVAGISRNLSHIPGWDIACLQGKTCDAAADFFGKNAISIIASDAAALATALIRSKKKAFVFFCGDRRLDHLPEALQQEGISIQEIIVYHTEETPVSLQEDYQGILFFSPSAVNSFFSANTLPADCTIFAIGKTTAKTITTYTSNKVIISPVSDEGTMIRHAINYYNEERLIT